MDILAHGDDKEQLSTYTGKQRLDCLLKDSLANGEDKEQLTLGNSVWIVY